MTDRILIVEDEPRIARFIQMELEHEGFATETEGDGSAAFERIARGGLSLVLLDLMLPGMDGMTICRRVRQFSDLPIIMLTARDDVEDRVGGLDCGANDYVTKPFAIEELLARIRAALRSYRPSGRSSDGADLLVAGDIAMRLDSYEVTVRGEPVELTRKEFMLLEHLLRNKRRVLSRDQILQTVWGYDYIGDTNVVDVYVRYLRAKIDERFGRKYIHTVRGVGYVLKD